MILVPPLGLEDDPEFVAGSLARDGIEGLLGERLHEKIRGAFPNGGLQRSETEP